MDNDARFASSTRKAQILDAAVGVFGRFGFKKTSMDDLARVAQLSKQGLYLHFSSKEEIFVAAMRKYLSDGLQSVRQELSRRDTRLLDRLVGAMDEWFGRHIETFDRDALDVIEAGDLLLSPEIEEYATAFQRQIETALANDPEFVKRQNVCTPAGIAKVLFVFGLSWKNRGTKRAEFLSNMRICIQACCQLPEKRKGRS